MHVIGISNTMNNDDVIAYFPVGNFTYVIAPYKKIRVAFNRAIQLLSFGVICAVLSVVQRSAFDDYNQN